MEKTTFHHDDIDRDCGCPHASKSYAPDAKVINLAIQGGGAHGAYAWGVIDRLLEDGRIKVEGLCGTSAGSMNAVVFAYGNMIGGRGGAREALYHLEMRAIAFVTKLIEEDWLKKEHKHKLKHLIMQSIRADGVLCDLSVASKFNTDWHFLLYLRDLGSEMADKWLKENFDSIGKRSTVDVRAEFLERTAYEKA